LDGYFTDMQITRAFEFWLSQFSQECWCGTVFGTHSWIAEGQCSTPCLANKSQTCGSRFKNSVYRTGKTDLHYYKNFV